MSIVEKVTANYHSVTSVGMCNYFAKLLDNPRFEKATNLISNVMNLYMLWFNENKDRQLLSTAITATDYQLAGEFKLSEQQRVQRFVMYINQVMYEIIDYTFFEDKTLYCKIYLNSKYNTAVIDKIINSTQSSSDFSVIVDEGDRYCEECRNYVITVKFTNLNRFVDFIKTVSLR